jgi:uncharacterized membrane protein (DUF4010 family)
VTVAVSWARQQWGQAGALIGALLSGFGDAHASVAAFAMLAGQDQLPAATATAGVLASITANSITRSITAFVAGGRAFGLRLGACLLLATLAAWLAWALGHGRFVPG